MKSRKHHESSFEEIVKDQKVINLVFLGIGLTMFLLNIASMLSYLPARYSFLSFNISTFASMIIILIAVYNLETSK